MIHRLSKIYWPLSVIPKDAIVKNQDITSKSQKLLLEMGFIKSAGSGTFYILPIAQKAIENCIKLIDKHMQSIGAQKLSLPILTSSALWKKSGRLDSCEDLLKTKDHQGKELILGPTHEESIAALIALSAPVSYKQMPLKLYQIGSKFRDELKPRFGLLRTKEFLMKDLYSFDVGEKEAHETYNEVGLSYAALFSEMGLPWVKVKASTGIMGGLVSHEYHIPCQIGEDQILNCKSCNFASNIEESGNTESCPECGGSTISVSRSIEIGHTFLLADKYSKALGATFLQSNGKPNNMFMGCYGIGVSRLVGASLEILSTEKELRWPNVLAPYKICIIPAKQGSKEELISNEWVEKISGEVSKICEIDSILLDDRTNLTIGKRLLDNKRMGHPIIIIVGSKSVEKEPKFEFHLQHQNIKLDLNFNELLSEVDKVLNKAVG